MPNSTPRTKSLAKKNTRVTSAGLAKKTVVANKQVRRGSSSSSVQKKSVRRSGQTQPEQHITNQHLLVMFVICLILFLITVSRVGL